MPDAGALAAKIVTMLRDQQLGTPWSALVPLVARVIHEEGLCAAADRDAAQAALRVAFSLAQLSISAAAIGLTAEEIAKKMQEALEQFAPEVRRALGEVGGA